MADQFRFHWIGATGAQFVKTPTLDTLASNGLMFTRAVCNSPVCAPSRVSLAAGVYGNRVGGYENGSAYYPARANGFRELMPSFYNVLANIGYRGAMAGNDVSRARLRRSVPTERKATSSPTIRTAAIPHSRARHHRVLGHSNSAVATSGNFRPSRPAGVVRQRRDARKAREPAELPPAPFTDELPYVEPWRCSIQKQFRSQVLGDLCSLK